MTSQTHQHASQEYIKNILAGPARRACCLLTFLKPCPSQPATAPFAPGLHHMQKPALHITPCSFHHWKIIDTSGDGYLIVVATVRAKWNTDLVCALAHPTIALKMLGLGVPYSKARGGASSLEVLQPSKVNTAAPWPLAFMCS